MVGFSDTVGAGQVEHQKMMEDKLINKKKL